jgi:hypothetical protein
MATDSTTATPREAPSPNPALERLDPLVGTWTLTGRTLDSDTDNIRGWFTIDWMPGRFVMFQRGDWDFVGERFESLEILHYDPDSDSFPAAVYTSNMASPLSYRWDVHENRVTHFGVGATYTGDISEDGNTITGGWRPDAGVDSTPGNAYDATMTRAR